VRLALIVQKEQSATFRKGLRSLGLRQSAAINNHPDCSGTLHRNLNESVPDPTFPAPIQKKVAVWLCETRNHIGHLLKLQQV